MTTMLYLAYTFEPTAHAHAHPEEFWAWMDARVAWFYRDLTMVLATSWRCESRADGLLVHHEVAFADEAGMAEYRAALAVRGRDQAWEQRRRDQDRWYRIVARSIQNSPPVPMALPRPDETAVARREAAADASRA
ncbi:hypothetical protein [Streptomyces europaeiscabiei]|uniref:hypothetical protein n=1 Tax=Streptomyces europaeiscabiei TaxID=146819 RepID=UPI0038F6C7F9